nr:trafficking protein particle complex subunit 10 [Quercus suber]
MTRNADVSIALNAMRQAYLGLPFLEYHDPSGIFPLISRDIAARLPLRNLNWQSPSRPLRQIRSLHVEFVPDQDTQNALQPHDTTTDSSRAGLNSLEILRSGRDSKKDASKERRHQIPGLKTSPYLKIYVLRCDDKDVYKEYEQKKIRAWIRELASSDGKRDNHNAFEWLILHVVIPDTLSASEPRWKEVSSKDLDEPKERPKSSAKWPGKSTRTVFDRLRADFNESSKTGPDRIAQIRLRKEDVPADLLPTPALATTLEETPQERENAWNDLMTKFKTSLLGPFDLRVRQYEADIAQQEARRSLPGWNFCTFFIHKEGLAKALESIGLVEDALAIYDELALGLETVVRDIASGQADGTATTFAEHTNDVRERIVESKSAAINGANQAENQDRRALTQWDFFKKDYRERIVRSTISVFDFFCYLFSRQKTLILRLANTRASQAALGASNKEGGEDLVLISEVCWRASKFIHNNARTLRQDLSCGAETGKKQGEIESLVCSWTYAVAQQVLEETAASALDSTSAQARPNTPNGTPQRPIDFSFGMGANPHPQRNSSLVPRKAPLPDLKTRVDSGNVSGLIRGSATIEFSAKPGIPGQPELAAYRAELLIMQRNMLEHLAESKGWHVGWAANSHAIASTMDEVDLNNEPTDEQPRDTVAVSFLLAPVLVSALESEANFHANYEYLSDLVMRHYAVATQVKTVQAIIADLAMLKYQQRNWDAAASYFQHVLPTFNNEGWSLAQTEMQRAYCKCLKALDRKEEYVNVSLDLLARTGSMSMGESSSISRGGKYCGIHLNEHAGVLTDVLKVSAGLSNEITRPMDEIFEDVRLEREVKHFANKDGFALDLDFRHRLDDTIKIDQIAARLVGLDDPSHEIWLASPGAVELVPGKVQVELQASVVASGPFLIDRIVFRAEKLRFVKEIQPQPDVPKLMIADTELTSAVNASTTAHLRPFVYLYPATQSFDVNVSLSKEMYIDRSRRLELKLESGRNNVQRLEIKMRSLSAGLRLHCAEAKVDAINRHEGDSTASPGQILLGGLAAGQTSYISVPYTLEQQQSSIFIRLEAHYQTDQGSNTLLQSIKLPSELPLDVDVDDVFHLETLYSTFTIRSTNQIPIVITGATLKESSAYAVEAPPPVALPMTIFHRQPARIAYKIFPKLNVARQKQVSRRETALALSVKYQSIEELVALSLRRKFTSDLEQSPFAALSRLLGPVLAERAQPAFTTAAMTVVALLKEFDVSSYDDLGWHDIIQTLPDVVQPGLREWLQTWHAENRRLTIEQVQAAGHAERCITIVVDVPTVDFVHRASLSLLDPEPLPAPGLTVLRLGQGVHAELRLRYTDAWSTKSVYSTNPSTPPAAPRAETFVFDIQADADTWLIDGQRRAHFTVAPGEDRVFPLVLLPLKLGYCPLPLISVQAAAAAPNPLAAVDDGTAAVPAKPPPAPPAISCETHVASAGQLVQVVRDVRTVRAHVLEGAAAAAPSSAGATGPAASAPASVTSGG